MPKIVIRLRDEDYQKVVKTIQTNGLLDWEHETFSGSEICLGITPIGCNIIVKGYQECEIDHVFVDFCESD